MMTIGTNGTVPGRGERTLSVLVDDHPGVLNRVASLLRRRRFNVDSLNVGASEQTGMSRMTISLRGDEAATEQAIKQLYKLIEVRKVIDLSEERLVTREGMEGALKRLYGDGVYLTGPEYKGRRPVIRGSTTSVRRRWMVSA